MLEIFMKAHGGFDSKSLSPVLELIKSNIKDPEARHLMIISNGTTALGILDQYLK